MEKERHVKPEGFNEGQHKHVIKMTSYFVVEIYSELKDGESGTWHHGRSSNSQRAIRRSREKEINFQGNKTFICVCLLDKRVWFCGTRSVSEQETVP